MRVVGLISGTSADGIDAALIELSGPPAQPQVTLLAGQTFPYAPDLQRTIWAVCAGEALTLERLATLDDAIAEAFAQAAIAIQQQLPAQLIGSHGQTVYHRPRGSLEGPSATIPQALAYSLQLGRGDGIAHRTGLPTVANFRQADISFGGEGAPLVPAVDAVLLRHPTQWRCVQNIGGIGNLTYLPPAGSPDPVLGWDTGPGNSLLDLAVQTFSNGDRLYDEAGAWAAQGTICEPLLAQWLAHPFFALPPPKSTGRELFGQGFLQQCLRDARAYDLQDADLLATLGELTAVSIAHSYRALPRLPDEVLLCGGGRHNRYLVSRLQYHLPNIQVLPTNAAGLDADYKEAIAFGLLAYWRWHRVPSNLPSVTGAARAVSLGEIYWPPTGAPDWTYDRGGSPNGRAMSVMADATTDPE